MRTQLAAGLLALVTVPLGSQAPASSAKPAPAATSAAGAAPAAQVERDDIGFSYRLPADWEFVAVPTAPKAVMPYPALATAAKGDACVDVALTAKHANPASVVVVIVLPFACYGQSMTTSDLENFGEGTAEGMKQSFDVAEPEFATYSLDSHAVWIERVKGTPKNHPESQFTFEIACTMLEKGAVCWLAMAADAASLQAFERSMVSLNGGTAAVLVPETAFSAPKP